MYKWAVHGCDQLYMASELNIAVINNRVQENDRGRWWPLQCKWKIRWSEQHSKACDEREIPGIDTTVQVYGRGGWTTFNGKLKIFSGDQHYSEVNDTGSD
jgi:hypothetical protein